MTEPYTDMPSLAIVAVGLILFGYLIFTAYGAYASSAYYASVKADLRVIAIAMAGDYTIALEGHPGVLVASKLDVADKSALSKYGHAGIPIQAIVDAGEYSWQIGNTSHGRSAGYRIPVTVALNDARCVPGTLTVISWER